MPFSKKYYAKSSKPNSHILHHLPKPIHQQATNSLASGDETSGFYPHNHNRSRLWEWGRRRCMESDRRRGRVVSSLSLSLSLSLSHLPFLRTYSATLPSLTPSILSAFVETESMDSLSNSFNPNKRLKEEFVFLSHPLSFFILYMPSSHFFLLLLIWVFQIRDQFDWVFHARSLCPFNYSLCKSLILFLIHIFLCPFSFFSYCSYCSHRFSLFFATHFPPIAISVMPTLCYLVL